MKPTRRTFLQYASLAPASLAAGVTAASPAPGEARRSALNRSDFLALVGDEFTFETSAVEKIVARLVSADPIVSRLPTQDAEGAFRLLFETAPGESLAQQTLPVAHPRLGRFALFVSPNDAHGRIVEAIFNRM